MRSEHNTIPVNILNRFLAVILVYLWSLSFDLKPNCNWIPNTFESLFSATLTHSTLMWNVHFIPWWKSSLEDNLFDNSRSECGIQLRIHRRMVAMKHGVLGDMYIIPTLLLSCYRWQGWMCKESLCLHVCTHWKRIHIYKRRMSILSESLANKWQQNFDCYLNLASVRACYYREIMIK